MSDILKKAVQSYQGGDFNQALAHLSVLMRKGAPTSQEIWSLLGNVHLRLGQVAEAAEAFAAGAERPGPNGAMLARFAMGLFARAGARARMAGFGARALALNPGDLAIAYDHAQALFDEGRFHEAAPLVLGLDRANPKHMALIINALRITGQFRLLARELDEAHARDPGNGMVAVSRFVSARETADLAVAREHDALMRDPASPAVAGLMASEPAMARLLWSPSDAVNALPSADSLRVAAMPAAPRRRPVGAAGERLRIGYLSSDFHAHATMRLFEDVLALHDRSRFEITLFCHTEPTQHGWQQDNLPADLMRSIVRVGTMDDRTAAAAIAERGIDILVDLKGHTMNARLGIARLSDAPVKATYIGYPGSVTGAGFDYAITDPVVTPDEAIPHFEESLCRLPECYQANGAIRRPLPSATSRAVAGLPSGAFVFASFNAVQKISPAAFDLWCRILKAVPDSLLWLYAEADIARQNLISAFAEAGIADERILFAAGQPYERHVARLGLADLGLDAFPYNGHTTTSDMLWAGLPLLTLKGQAFQSRVSESLLKAAGIEGLVADDPEDFVRRAIALAADPRRIAALKDRIEENRFRAPLFDSERFTAHLEDAYLRMAERARLGLGPALIDVPALPPRREPFSSRRRGG